MRYDPIMCMMVDDSIKMKDTNKYVEKAVQLIKEGKGPLYVLSALKGMGLTPSDANKWYAEARSQTGYRNYDNKGIDHAIRSCDEEKDRYEVVKIGEFLYGIYDNVKKKVVIESTKTGIESYSKMFNAKNLNNPKKI